MARSQSAFPYQGILADLLASVMRAQAEVIDVLKTGGPLETIQPASLNRHFTWLAYHYRRGGEDRHLFEASAELASLRTEGVRKKMDPSDAGLLKARGSIPLDHPKASSYVQSAPTRISQLVKLSFEALWDLNKKKLSEHDEKSSGLIFALRSPLAIVRDYLTDPGMPGSQAYALLATRNLIFDAFGSYPDGLGNEDQDAQFSVHELGVALAHVWTSGQPRRDSKGKDTLASETNQPVEGITRQFLAMKDTLWLAFSTLDAASRYCHSQQLRSEDFRLRKSDYLERFPELNELVNELWGLPVPIRGADTIFRGGLKFSSRKGLVMALHGGPGAGKTTLALAFGAFLAPLGVETLFITAEEQAEDLEIRAEGIIPAELRRTSFYPKELKDWLTIVKPPVSEADEIWPDLRASLEALSSDLSDQAEQESSGTPKPCRAVVVLDGIYDLLVAEATEKTSGLKRLRDFIERCRSLQALVIITLGEEQAEARSLDYLVDIAIHVTNDSVDQYARKPDRRIKLIKARHQLCATGTHGLLFGGEKGVRFTPQISYQLERRAIWKPRIPNEEIQKDIFARMMTRDTADRLPDSERNDRGGGKLPITLQREKIKEPVYIAGWANIFLSGIGSNGKAALALKMAFAPYLNEGEIQTLPERVLVVSFLYPNEYYQRIKTRLIKLRDSEYDEELPSPDLRVIHLYPGYLRPNVLFNRIEWEIESAELRGIPYTTVIIDGIHNVYLQFPEITTYGLLWPQLYSSLRSRDLMVITTHSTLVLADANTSREQQLDDGRSEPLRHALVQKTDYRFDLTPSPEDGSDFIVEVKSAINQGLPKKHDALRWSREKLVVFANNVQMSLDLESPNPRRYR